MISYPPEVQESLILGQDRFVWEAPMHERYERGSRWYIIMAVIAFFLIAYAVWTENFLFAFLILLMAIILVLTGNEEPKHALVQIGDAGIVWDGKLCLYRDLDHFAIVYQPPQTKVLYLDHRNPIIPRLRIPLEEENPLELRDHLKQFLREDLDLHDEHLSDIVARLLRI
ncbi:MAG TPA: hypothetical protein VFQ60_04240 [Patescibacteria group bacterium]|nr:hypothetical protein [Patescibacteria group bacterium]